MVYEKLKASKEETQDIPDVCALDIDDIFIKVHEKAIAQVKKEKTCIIKNSAIIENGKNLEFYGAGKHIIAAVPVDGGKNAKISKADALKAIVSYVQWFAGPDVSQKITDKDLQAIEAEKDDSVKESFSVNIPSFSKYLLLEDGEEPSSGEAPADEAPADSEGGEKPEDKKEEDKKDDDKKDEENPDEAAGWYISYQIDVEGQKSHTFAETFGKFLKALKNTFFKIGFKISSFRGSGEWGFTLNDIKNTLEGIFGKIDPNELKQNFMEQMKPYPQARAQVEIFDKETLVPHIKAKIKGKEAAKINDANLSFCVKIHRNDKSRKVINKDLIARLITRSIKGIIKTLRNGVDPKNIILINGYSENDKSKDKMSRQLKNNLNDESMISIDDQPFVFEEGDSSEGDSSSEGSEDKIKDTLDKMKTYFQGEVDKKFGDAEKKEATIQSSKDVVNNLLKPNGANDEKAFSEIQKHENAFTLELVTKKPAGETEAKESLQVLHANLSLLKMLFETITIEDDPDGTSLPNDIKNKVEKLFKNLVNNKDFLDAVGKAANSESDEIYAFNVSETKSESIKGTRNLYNMLFESNDDAQQVLEDLLFEGHSEEQKNLISQIKRIGAENFTKNIDEITKAYRQKLADVRKEQAKNEYIQKSITLSSKDQKSANSDHWIDKEFVRQSRKLTSVDEILKLLDEVVSKRVGKTNDKKYELDALASVLEKYPDDPNKKEDKVKFIFKAPKDPAKPDGDLQQLGDPVEVEKGKNPEAPDPPEFDGYEFEKWDPDPKTLKDPEGEQDIVATYKKKDDEQITITFKDIDDPSELEDPSKLSDDDKKKYKDVGEPLKIVPGEDVKIPDIKNKGKWEFMGFEPDPENMDETGDTYAMYEKNGPDTVEIKFYEADPEKNEKTGEPIKTIEVEEGKPVNSTDEGKAAFEELNKKFDDDKKDGFERKGWNQDPATKAEKDLEFYPKYISNDDKDKEFTVVFQYPPDPEKEDKVEEIEGELGTQKIKAGESAKAPEPPEIDGWKFKEWSDDFSNVTDDMTVIAKYQKPVKFIFKVPKDPEKPDDLEQLGDPIEFEEGKEITPPDPPDLKDDGYEFEKWDPDPKTIKDPEGDQEIVAKYKKNKPNAKFIFKVPKDPEKPDDLEQLGDPVEYEEGKEIKPPAEPPKFDGYEFDKWDPDPKEIKDPEGDQEIVAKYKKLTEDEAKLHTIFVMPDYSGILDPADTIGITFTAPKLDETDPSKTKMDDPQPLNKDPVKVLKDTPIEVDKKTLKPQQNGKDIPGAPTIPNLEKAGFEFDKFEPDASSGLDKDTTLQAVYKEKKGNKTGNELTTNSGDYDFYIVPMKGLRYKDPDEEAAGKK